MHNDEAIEHLNHLIRVNQDAEAGYRNAAANAKNSEIESVFTDYAGQHARFQTELRKEIERLDGSAEHTGTLSGSLHRGWMDLKSALTGSSAASMLGACDDGELSAEVAYTDVIKANPTGQTLTVVEKQLNQIKGFRAHLRRLVDEAEKGLEFQKNK